MNLSGPVGRLAVKIAQALLDSRKSLEGKQDMWKAVLTLLSVTLAASAAQAQVQSGGQWADKLFVGYEADGVKVLTKDFGTVAKGGQFLHTFKLHNPYGVTLQITTKVECNCVTVTPKQLVLEPKQNGDLNITMDTTRFVGNKNVHIEAFVNGPGGFNSQATLLVTAQIRADLVLNPGQINLGTLKSGQAATAQTLDVEYAGATNFQITEVVDNNAPVKVTYKELYRQPGAGGNRIGYRVTAELKEGASAGGFRQEVFLRTNDPAGPLLPIPVEGFVQASLSAVPNTLEVGSLKLGDEKLQRVMVRGGQPFRIIGIEGAGDGITYELPAAPSMIQTVVFHFKGEKTGDVSRKIQIKTDLASDSAVSIKVEGTVAP
jgi:hypothetical protein